MEREPLELVSNIVGDAIFAACIMASSSKVRSHGISHEQAFIHAKNLTKLAVARIVARLASEIKDGKATGESEMVRDIFCDGLREAVKIAEEADLKPLDVTRN